VVESIEGASWVKKKTTAKGRGYLLFKKGIESAIRKRGRNKNNHEQHQLNEKKIIYACFFFSCA
jgi:hypothetical protein